MDTTTLPSYVPTHHAAWLKAHPHRSLAWLAQQTADGFDIHHIDSDKNNNDPNNLVLIEHTDHMRLHGSPTLGRVSTLQKPKKPSRKALGKRLYHGRLDTWDTWGGLAKRYGARDEHEAIALALSYAKANGLEWPLNVPRINR